MMAEINAECDLPISQVAVSSLAHLFQEVRLAHGLRTAVSMGADSVTYAELGAKADGVAGALKGAGLRHGAIVAIYLERSIAMVEAMLGVVKAGMTYLPIDPSYPAARVAETLADAKPAAILASRGLAGRLEIGAKVLLLEEIAAGVEAGPLEARAEDVAYILYTSGSTGKPKGVMVSHANVVRLFTQTEPWFHFDERDVWTMFHSFSFDFSVWEMWGPLLTGGRLVIVPFAVSRSPEDFHALLEDEGVTVLNQTPSAFCLLLDAEARVGTRPLALRVVIFGGEALNLRALRPWLERHGDEVPELVNMYGITETTVHVTYRRVWAEDAEQETDSLIGVAIPDLQLHLLDGELRPVKSGEVGEICVGGAGVALGYLNRPELTRERFVADPLGDGLARIYRSGDLARRREDGELVYLGRADRQVKVNGFRIELGEVEAALAECEGVQHACVVGLADEHGGQRLAAYFVSAGLKVDAKTLSRLLAERLPVHMRPAFYVPIATLPLNANGKIDRDALPSPETVQAKSEGMRASEGSSVQDRVAAVWRRVLQNDGVGMDDNFFDVGGSSLLLIAVRTALADEFKQTIPIMWMFECTTIRSVAAKLGAGREAAFESSSRAADKAQRQRDSFAKARALRSVAR